MRTNRPVSAPVSTVAYRPSTVLTENAIGIYWLAHFSVFILRIVVAFRDPVNDFRTLRWQRTKGIAFLNDTNGCS